MSFFEKEFSSDDAAEEAVRRSDIVRRQGLRTPVARVKRSTVIFGRIEGRSGLTLTQEPMQAVLGALACLHHCDLPGAPRMDPLRMIHPRLKLLENDRIRAALDILAANLHPGDDLLHGDFHLGQVIRDFNDDVWLVDLDDLCIGPPEADLGNLIANLSTQTSGGDDFATRLNRWRHRICSAWLQSDQALREAVLDQYVALSLIRRHLKLREMDRPDFGQEIADWITPVAGRISPSDTAVYPG